MGDLLTHVAQADRVVAHIESNRIREGVRAQQKWFRLGAQGPDPLFFHHCFPGNGKGEMVPIGERLHAHRTGAFLTHGFRQLHPVSWGESWMQLAAYLCGFVCHFCTDRYLHPYVNGVADQWIWSADGLPVRTTHAEVERILDVVVWREAGHGSATRARMYLMCPGPAPWADPIVNFWITSLYEVYGLHVTEKQLAEVARDFHRGNRLLYDPRGVMKKILQWLDGLTGGAVHPAKVPHPLRENPQVDWMNGRHRTWFQPELPDTKRRESVRDLLDASVDEAANAINGLFAVLLRGEGRMEDWLPNLDYNTNLPCVEES